eukprot:3917250-Amphidinium_carterae.1
MKKYDSQSMDPCQVVAKVFGKKDAGVTTYRDRACDNPLAGRWMCFDGAACLQEDLNLAASRATLGLALLIHLAKAFTDTTAMQSLTITTPVAAAEEASISLPPCWL